jgi:hypothetical protein
LAFQNWLKDAYDPHEKAVYAFFYQILLKVRKIWQACKLFVGRGNDPAELK